MAGHSVCLASFTGPVELLCVQPATVDSACFDSLGNHSQPSEVLNMPVRSRFLYCAKRSKCPFFCGITGY